MTQKPLLVTSALPYANGPAHLGHIVENVQSDVWVRFQRLTGRDVLFICAADSHGTPIEVNAKKLGVEPEALVAKYRAEHERDFRDFGISFDEYASTHSDENRAFVELIYEKLKQGGHVFEKPVEQFYCDTDKRFLPDRFVKGTCPNCGALEQYGDVCEVCKKTYAPTDLKAPFCVLCRNAPVRRESGHIFVRLGSFTDFLRSFSERLQPEVRNYVSSWIDEGLKDWDVSRDGPYFGFRIPGTEDKYFYVWLDAPIGYISSAATHVKKTGADLERYWPGTRGGAVQGGESEIVHVIGKDIIYFHTLFWPAMLHAAGFAIPDRIQVHGMLNFGGQKMSKSRGRMITARDWLAALDPSYLRYYLGANLGASLDDIDFSLEELRNRVNAHLVNNVGNLANRVLSFVKTRFDGRLSTPTKVDDAWVNEGAANAAREAYAAFDLRGAVREAEKLASWANEFMQSAAPWKEIKTDPAKAQADVTLVANVVKAVATMLWPVVPKVSEEIFSQLGVSPKTWDEGVRLDLVDHAIGTPRPVLPPLEQATLDALFAPKEPPAPVAAPVEKQEERAAEIQWEDFEKVDLRVGIVREAERIPKADKLLKLLVDVGEAEPRTIVAGIALAYAPEELVGRRVTVVANLAPKKLRGVLSHGMLLAASGGEKGLVLADIPGDVAPGTRVK